MRSFSYSTDNSGEPISRCNECTPPSAYMPSPDDSLIVAMSLSSWMAGLLSPAGRASCALSTPASVFSRPGGVDWCLSHLQSDLRTRIKGLKERIRHLESRISDLRHVIRHLRSRINDLGSVIRHLKPVISDLRRVIRPLSERINVLRPVIRHLKAVIRSLKPVIRPLSEWINVLRPVI